MPSSKTYLISGMHRSGTSLVASLLRSSGIHIGDKLLGSNESNPLGHFEDMDFLNLHQGILGEDNRDGLKLTQLPSIGKNHILEAEQLLKHRNKRPLWGWKDPRTSLFLEFWKELLPESFSILIYRHPIEVIISLIRRSTDFELISQPQNAVALWRHYNQKILEFKRAHPNDCLLCNLSGVTNDIDHFLKQISQKSEIDLNIEGAPSEYKPSRLTQYHWPDSIEELIQPIIGDSLNLFHELETLADLPGKTDGLPPLEAPWSTFASIIDDSRKSENEVLSSLSYLVSNIISPSLTSKFFQASNTLVSAQREELRNRKSIITEQIDSVHAAQKVAEEFKQQGIQQQHKMSQLYLEADELNRDIAQLQAKHQEDVNSITDYQNELEKSTKKAAHQEKSLERLNSRLAEHEHKDKQHQQTILELTNLKDSTQALLNASQEENAAKQANIDSNTEILTEYSKEIARQSEINEANSKRLLLANMRVNKVASGGLLKIPKVIIAIISRAWGGYTPHPLFDAHWYKTNNPRSRLIHMFPYVHYSLFGWREGRDPSPFFDTLWYLSQNPDVLDAYEEPLEHYVANGWKEGRDPSPKFSTSKYVEQFPELVEKQINPLIHFVSNLTDPAADLTPYHPDKVVFDNNTTFEPSDSPNNASYVSNGPSHFEEEVTQTYKQLPVKLIAFYLPQFHPIPENDLFWGKGFTEWKNVTKARPQFKGHNQPNLPGSLGFYDLRVPEVMENQANLAKQYGIEGFCFHFYWFNGQRVLERPIEQLLANPSIQIEYCINWANENWTRSWDGKTKEVLIPQNHNPQDDIDFINEAKRFFDDPRYIRVDSKPVLMLYNPTLLPDAEATAKRWRARSKELGFEIFLLVAETHGFNSQSETWFDGLVEFPPLRRLPEDTTHKHETLTDFKGNIFDYADLAEIHSEPQEFKFPVFKTVSPGWDNTARRGNKATIFAGSTPELYRRWLSSTIQSTLCSKPESQRLVFVNAWNEWAEGAYLEPDSRHGYAYLNATARALKQFDTDQQTLVFTSHDTNLGGAQNLLLTLLQWFRSHTDLNIKIVCASGGVLQSKFESLYPTFIVDDGQNKPEQQTHLELIRFCGDNVLAIFMNTVVSASLLKYLSPIAAPRILYAHELKNSIEKFYGSKKFAKSVDMIDAYIGGSQPVIDNLIESYGVPESKTSVLESFIVSSQREADISNDQYLITKQLRKEQLGLDRSSTIVLGCGMIEWRKGPDLFADVAKKTLNQGQTDIKFVWIGPIPTDPSITKSYQKGLEDILHFVGEKKDFKPYFEAADVFLLPSREDPFPLVCLEAADSELPVITFADNGGSPKFISDSECGYVVPYEDTAAMTEKLRLLVEDRELRHKLGKNGHEAVLQNHSDRSAGPIALEKIRQVSALKPRVSIIVPAFNHGPYLRKRLESIYNQSFQDFEVILLDDASGDQTSSILSEYEHKVRTRLYSNKINSGSPFSQWQKGIDLARSDLIWIAEDDDFCEHDFLEKMLPLFDDSEISLAYCQSYAVDTSNIRQFSYIDYYKHQFEDYQRWETGFKTSGEQELNQGLASVNTIPNASAVIFRKFDTTEWQKKWLNSRLAGDWAFYLHALRNGKVAFMPAHLNYHRRHQETMTHKTKNADIRFKEVAEVHRDALDHFTIEDSTKNLMRSQMKGIWSDVAPRDSDKKFDAAYNSIINS